VSREGGGHREAAKFGLPPLFSLEVKYLPFNSERFNVDIEAACSMIEKHRPRVVILGSSNFLFPHPVRQIKAAMQQINPESILLYDGSHVMGFLAVGEFQKPLEEGADVVFGSTHKTLPGPQGGIILTNREDLIDRISEAVYPALVTNHHAFRMPALGLALGEIEEFGHDYIEQVSANAHILGSALEERGVPCIKVDGKYSCSHIILAIVSRFGTGEKIALRLEEAGIITTSTQLPDIMSKEGIRFGVQEITRIGATNDDMSMVAELISQAIMQDRPTAEIAQDVFAFRSSLGSIHFTWRST
jgi:glycine hydroxymethyltransferase